MITTQAAIDLVESNGSLIPGEAVWDRLEKRGLDPARLAGESLQLFNILGNIALVKADILREDIAKRRQLLRAA
ncbi:hypothetical protein A3J32_03265 [Candidatus Saccharibacteria bacterium RIFCSPLOWO2_02_FULL_46_7]|nr:MAG: hypothetical protein A3J32_03265 [Candidatus Saccharibacteria bacterium RIFCSPLOWO2_02_FULL_46_7]